ncbi:Asp-tRNA(Asn)/Glu-tRNA(Gln) amidotransferase subunit GatA [Patescibacteria group bacterium]|nr:Asp-tRNA(Asn)/Glu-tRNA(Gln) amidotransferase subunit GatA [Patescibacteria group bacterium]MBU2219041.1 Asp-tRNA(Asn)/Glu-tRNA(Gln) amidotransferase subunit GatA [Patescibacteria group bacterium]MBU2263610.1 Asp-tRNA(Asn)/Glu-tRNA(Gln) amidotransferase subunit GatA [Patescibacteria group bacterium]
MIDLKNLTIKKAQKMIQNREISVAELVSAYQENIKNKNKDINAYLEVFNDPIGEIDETKPLAGIPFAIKDNMLIKGKICSASSKILENYHAAYDATVIKKLRDAGAIFLGRTNMDEFAMGASTENSAFGSTKNPFDLERVAGGSSGGSAAAVAADLGLAALGSDTGGSIRQPAGFCGVVGLNPTYGAVSRYGLIAMASSFDQIGPITKTVEDAEIIFNIIKGRDPLDSTSIDSSQSSVVSSQKLRIGLLKYDKSGINDEVNRIIEETIKKLKNLGHEIKEIELPHIEYSVPCYYILVPAEVSANLARFDGVRYGLSKQGKNLLEDYMETRASGFGKEVRRRIMLGTYVLSAGYYDEYYGRAKKVRVIIRKDFEKVFGSPSGGGIDVILTPTSPAPAFKIGEKTDDPLQMYLEDIFTAPAKIAGLPAMSVPAGFAKSGLPIGVQFIAPWFREDILFHLGKQYENDKRTLY